jgi:hypothetical protein
MKNYKFFLKKFHYNQTSKLFFSKKFHYIQTSKLLFLFSCLIFFAIETNANHNKNDLISFKSFKSVYFVAITLIVILVECLVMSFIRLNSLNI